MLRQSGSRFKSPTCRKAGNAQREKEFYRKLGTWYRKICNLCKRYGILVHKYTVHPNDIMIMFKENDAEDNKITIEKLEELLGIGYTTVKKILSEMQIEGYIQCIGANKGGYWGNYKLNICI